MIILPVQLDNYRSRAGENLVTFSSYPQHVKEFSKFIENGLGKEYMLIAIPTDSKELEEFQSETKEETIERFRRHMNALIEDIAKLKGKEKDVYRKEVKDRLIKLGQIKKSTNELGLDGLALLISKLKEVKEDLEHGESDGN